MEHSATSKYLLLRIIRNLPEFSVVVYYLHPQVDGTRSVYVYKYVVCVFFDSVGGVVSAKLSNLII